MLGTGWCLKRLPLASSDLEWSAALGPATHERHPTACPPAAGEPRQAVRELGGSKPATAAAAATAHSKTAMGGREMKSQVSKRPRRAGRDA